MIGRCDRGHIHIATTDDIPSLRALEDVTPAKEITKVPSRCFLTARAIPQELTNCPMVFKIRFECPLESTTANDDVSKPLPSSIEEPYDNIANPHDGDVVQDTISRLETKLGKFERKMNERGMKDMTKFFLPSKSTVLNQINDKDSLVDALNTKIHELENRIVDLEAKQEKSQNDGSDFTVIDNYIDVGEVAAKNHLQVREDSLVEALNEKVSELQNKIANLVVSDERICQLEAEVKAFQMNNTDFTIVENNVDRSDATIKRDLECVHEKMKILQEAIDFTCTELSNSTYARIVTLEDHLLQLATTMEETKTSSLDADAIKEFRDRVEEVDAVLSEHMMKNAVIVDDTENRLLKFENELETVKDDFGDQLRIAKSLMRDEIQDALQVLSKATLDDLESVVEDLKKDFRDTIEETKDGISYETAEKVDKLEKKITKLSSSQNTEEKYSQSPFINQLEPQPSSSRPRFPF